MSPEWVRWPRSPFPGCPSCRTMTWWWRRCATSLGRRWPIKTTASTSWKGCLAFISNHAYYIVSRVSRRTGHGSHHGRSRVRSRQQRGRPRSTMRIPATRGPVSSALFAVLAQAPDAPGLDLEGLCRLVAGHVARSGDIIGDEDLQLALFCLYELHYSGLDGVSDNWEWEPGLIRVRQVIEEPFEAALRAAAQQAAGNVELPAGVALSSDEVAEVLFGLAAMDTGPSVSRYVARKASLDQLKEFLVHKSMYQLKEADPHTWAIPRLSGRPKAALVEIQADEYGGGRPERMHSALFARTMRGLDLDPSYGAHVDSVPPPSP